MQRLSLIVLLSLLLAACATPSQRQAQNMRTVLSSASSGVLACMEEVYDAPEAAPIRAKRPLILRDATLEQLNDKSLASDDEIKAEYAMYPKIQACRRKYIDQIALTTPTIASILLDEYHATDELLLALVNRQKTWGEYLTQTQSQTYTSMKEVVSEGSRINGNLQRATQAELAQRQQALNGFQNYLQNQQLIDSLNRPTFINCSTFGSSTNCFSR